MTELPFLVSGGVYAAFIERIRLSPKARVDTDWLVESLGISQRANAGRTLNWLQRAKIVDEDGLLTSRGESLLADPADAAYQSAALAALKGLLDGNTLERLRSGELTRNDLSSEFEKSHAKSTVTRAMVGFRVLAKESSDSRLIACLGKARYEDFVPIQLEYDLDKRTREILEQFKLFTGGTGGIDGWLSEKSPKTTFARLIRIPLDPLTAEQLNQLLTLDHAPPLSRAFFTYYWLTEPKHTYNLTVLPSYSPEWHGSSAVCKIDQMYWGMHRIYVDALLYFGNVREAYQELRSMSLERLEEFFAFQRSKVEISHKRGAPLELSNIPRDDRYLISEMACKSYEPEANGVGLPEALRDAYRDHEAKGGEPVPVSKLLDKNDSSSYMMLHHADKQGIFAFAAGEVLDEVVDSEEALVSILDPIRTRFAKAREAATQNTKLYLSAVGELDVYVATSMREREHFHNMADLCEIVFGSPQLQKYDLRYFDPTLSAAENHEDKGLIECLMVKCARVLIYHAGDRDSYGKDAEAAMALSLGRPVIFFCSSSEKENFYKEVHPLTRLVDFATGVAVGAMVTDRESDVIELLDRLFTNRMEYELEEKRPDYLVLREKLTGSVVRIQTSDELLRETFWNHYHKNRDFTLT